MKAPDEPGGSESTAFAGSSWIKFVRILASAMDAGDPFTHGRPYRCSKYCLRLGRHFALESKVLEQLEYAALLQDIGKKALYFGILQKPRRLTPGEREQIKAHPKVSSEILAETGFLQQAADILLAQHEQPDGNGYPHGLPADRIPLPSRILAVVSAFDAMTSDRPYRSGLMPDEAYLELRDNAGTMFFADVVEAFIALHSSGEIFEEFDLREIHLYLPEDAGSLGLIPFLAQHGIRRSEQARTIGRVRRETGKAEVELSLPEDILDGGDSPPRADDEQNEAA